MVAELLGRIRDQEVVRDCLRGMFKFRDQEWVEGVLREGSKLVVVDHIGMGIREKGKSKSIDGKENAQN